ncbi:hypothetical protein [Oscillibacter sp.]|uniref:hypothetical protein n=1 Tax=Oscillibacter sp. TaxID=1945593 RepID=UPI002897CDD3|nr:hypothetical protein [Oscillibacter sp.]
MKLKFTNPILPIGEIKIADEFYKSMPHLEKLKKCMDFYRANGHFDRQIIVDEDKTLHDGYCAYLVAYLLGVERVKVLMVGEQAEPIKAVAPATPEPVKVPAPATPEPVKLYCIKSYKPGEWLTKGNVYTCEAAHKHLIRYDGCEVSYGDWFTRNIDGHKLTDHLVPLVSRPAKVGEWVYVLDTSYATCNDREPGDIFLIDGDEERPEFNGRGFIWGSGLYANGNGPDGGHYLVLDGYTGDAE